MFRRIRRAVRALCLLANNTGGPGLGSRILPQPPCVQMLCAATSRKGIPMFRKMFLMLTVTAFTGCGPSLSGDEYGGRFCPYNRITFKDSGNVSVLGSKGVVDASYTVKDNMVTITWPNKGGQIVFRRWGESANLEFRGMNCELIKKGQGSVAERTGGRISGITMIIGGLAGLLWVGRRKFYRRNVAGIEEFPSYGSALFWRLIEALAILVGVAAIIIGTGFIIDPRAMMR